MRGAFSILVFFLTLLGWSLRLIEWLREWTRSADTRAQRAIGGFVLGLLILAVTIVIAIPLLLIGGFVLLVAVDSLGPPAVQHIHRVSEGFAISLPMGWKYVDAAEAGPAHWWGSGEDDDAAPTSQGSVTAGHEVPEFYKAQIVDGLLLSSRTRSPFVALEWCDLYDRTGFAAPDPERTVSWDADDPFIRDLALDSDRIAFEAFHLELPLGRTVAVDSRWQDGSQTREYTFVDGETWFNLRCGTSEALPDDRWLSIAESFEFLTGE